MLERNALIETMARAYDDASCPHREGPYGLYDYSKYPGKSPPHVVRDFRDLSSEKYGAFAASYEDRDSAEAEYKRLTKQHIYGSILSALEAHLKASGYAILPLEAPADIIKERGVSHYNAVAKVLAERDAGQ